MTLDSILDNLPSNEEIEKAALGAMIQGGSEIVAIAIEELNKDDFYYEKNRQTFNTITGMFSRSEGIDEIALSGRLAQESVFDSQAARHYCTSLATVGIAANVETYCAQLKDLSAQRDLIKASAQILLSAKNSGGKSAQELVSEAEGLIYGVTGKREKNEAVRLSSAIEEIEAEAQEAIEMARLGTRKAPRCTSTKYVEIDRFLNGGFWPGELSILAARPSMGKTTFAINIARKIASNENGEAKAVAIFSLEMPAKQITKNILAASCGIMSIGAKLRNYAMTEDEYGYVIQSAENLKSSPILIDDSAGLTIEMLRAKIRRLKSREKIELVIIDYLQLLRTSKRYPNRQEEVSAISRDLKQIALEMEIPLLVLGQLNRRVEGQDGAAKRPQLSDLRESGAIEQDADVVMMLFREDYCQGYQPTNGASETEVIIQKNRNGEIGTAKVLFHKDRCLFEPYSGL